MSRTSTEKEINTAYKKLAMKYHPDRTRGDEAAAEKFKEIATAYAVRELIARTPKIRRRRGEELVVLNLICSGDPRRAWEKKGSYIHV